MALVEEDIEHLRLLKISHYIFGGIQALFALFPLLHLGFGLLLLSAPNILCTGNQQNCPPMVLGGFFVFIASLFIIIGLTMAGIMILNGRFLGKHQHHTACLIFSILECLLVPYGTILGAFTLIVLSRPTVKALFVGASSLPLQETP